MSKKYTYARTINTIHGAETFTADGFDSFDEGKKAVEKGIHDRNLELKGENHGSGIIGLGKTPTGATPIVPAGNTPLLTTLHRPSDKKCKFEDCMTTMSKDAPDYCPDHNDLNY